jgi:hypothetical protein
MSKVIGMIIANVLIGLIIFYVVGYFGGPKWACMGFALVAYLVAVNGGNTRRIMERKK